MIIDVTPVDQSTPIGIVPLGPRGFSGWTPVLAIVEDDSIEPSRHVHQVVDWIGVGPSKPDTGLYVGVSGLVEDIEDAINLSPSDYYTQGQVDAALALKADDADLATVAKSGSYNDLLNQPDLQPVATSGSYDDLQDKPVIDIADLDAKTDAVTYDTLMALAEDDTDNEKVAVKRLFEAGGVMPFRNIASAQAVAIPAPVVLSSVAGINYLRADNEPSHNGKFRSSDRWTAAGDHDSANGGWWMDPTWADITLRIPSDFPTLQAAIDATHHVRMVSGARIVLLVEAGHALTSGITVTNGDYGCYLLRSEDEVLLTHESFTGRVIDATCAIAPTLDAYVDGGGNLERIYSLFGSVGRVTVGNGGEGCHGRPLYGNSSFVQGGQSEWRNSADSIYFSAGSGAQLGECIIEGFTVTANGTLVASRGSAIEAQGMHMANCLRGIECKRAGSSVNAHESTYDEISGFIARSNRGGRISLEEAVATNVVNSALEAIGGDISAGEGASFTAKTGNTSRGCIVQGAASLNLRTSTVAGFGLDNVEADGGFVDLYGGSATGAGRHNLFAHDGGKIAGATSTITGAVQNAARVQNGGEIAIRGATTRVGEPGVPNVADTNVNGFGGFNAVASGGRGIIWT